MAAQLHDPDARDAHYGRNIAQCLVDMSNGKQIFNFCGGLPFQLVLSEKLKAHLASVSKGGDGSDGSKQPVVHDAATTSMSKTPGYKRTAAADNVRVFHGREVRKVPDAAGGRGFVLQLVMAGADDPDGWTEEEVAGYDGWGHDTQRKWRKGGELESEGYAAFRSTFGREAFTLHHRFFLHLDRRNQLWLSAEDGCEGHPAQKRYL